MSHVGTIRVGRLLCEGAEAVTGIALLVISDFPWYCMLWTSRRRRNGQIVSAPLMFCRGVVVTDQKHDQATRCAGDKARGHIRLMGRRTGRGPPRAALEHERRRRDVLLWMANAVSARLLRRFRLLSPTQMRSGTGPRHRDEIERVASRLVVGNVKAHADARVTAETRDGGARQSRREGVLIWWRLSLTRRLLESQ